MQESKQGPGGPFPDGQEGMVPSSQEQYSGRKGSIIAQGYPEGKRHRVPPPEQVPTNEEVAKAVQQKIAVRGSSLCH